MRWWSCVRADDADRESKPCQHQTASEEESNEADARRAKRRADPDLVRPLRDGAGGDRVDPDRRQRRGD
jgi:hypothetical protein